jgi:hypothetical protein
MAMASPVPEAGRHGYLQRGLSVVKEIALVMALGAMSAALAPSVARADPQVLTDAQMDAVTAAAGVVHLNLPPISVIVLNVPDINITANLHLGDILENNNVTARNIITQVAVATTVGIAVCGICPGGFPQVTGSAFALNNFFTRHSLP